MATTISSALNKVAINRKDNEFMQTVRDLISGAGSLILRVDIESSEVSKLLDDSIDNNTERAKTQFTHLTTERKRKSKL
jgi:hypothetical protein